MISNADIKHAFRLAGLDPTDINPLSSKSELQTTLKQTRSDCSHTITGRFILPGVIRP